MIYIQPPLQILLKQSSIGTGNQDKMSNAQSSVKLEGENSNSSTNHLNYAFIHRFQFMEFKSPDISVETREFSHHNAYLRFKMNIKFWQRVKRPHLIRKTAHHVKIFFGLP